MLPPAAGGTPDNSGKIQLPNKYDPSWEAAFQKLSPEDQQAYFNNDPMFVEGDPAPVDPNSPADPNAPKDPNAPPAITADDPITPELLESLPPNVKALVDQALEMEERIAPFEKFLNPEFQEDLRMVMEDPRVMAIVQDMKAGNDSADSWFEKSVDMNSIIKGLEDKFQIQKMDFTMDAEGSMEIFKKSLVEVANLVARNVMIHGEMKAREAKESARRETVKNTVFFNLAKSVENLKSKEPIESETHPIHGFRQHIDKAIADGEISWKYFEANGEALYAAYAAKTGTLQTPQKQFANIRSRLLVTLDRAAVQTAVSSTTMRPGSQVPAANVRHGIDSARYLSSSEAERSKFISMAMEQKERGNPAMLRDIQALEATGKWPG